MLPKKRKFDLSKWQAKMSRSQFKSRKLKMRISNSKKKLFYVKLMLASFTFHVFELMRKKGWFSLTNHRSGR